jgi:hypothetical protein
VWGAFKMPARVLGELYELWLSRDPRDEYIGTLVNEYLARGGVAAGVRAGQSYVDVGTLNGYREAMRLLEERAATSQAPAPRYARARDAHPGRERDWRSRVPVPEGVPTP